MTVESTPNKQEPDNRGENLPPPLPVTFVPGVDPADVWEAAAQAEAGHLIPHEEVFARLRSRPR